MFDVFVSYARGSQRSTANAAHAALEARGHRVFLDVRDVHPGMEIPVTIRAALDEARVLLVFLDDAFLTRSYCWLELEAAMGHRSTRDAASIVLALDPVRQPDLSLIPP